MISNKIENGINGDIVIPGDKSISHRSIIIPSISLGVSEINNLLISDDVLHTLEAFRSMGVDIEVHKEKVIVNGKGLNSLKKPKKNIYLGNSGTSARLLTGLLASQSFNSTIEGDKSLSSRPMKRIIDPLKLMGADIISENYCAPLKFRPSALKGINYRMDVASAQVKSCLILATLGASSKTILHQPALSRDHTERMLMSMGADIQVNKNVITINPGEIMPKDIVIPGDFSSAAFWIVAALIHPNGNILLKNVGINPLRTGIIDVLIKMGGNIEIINRRDVANEPVADIRVAHSELKGVEINGDIIPKLIDEIPIIIIAASVAKGPTLIKDAYELRVKETDRLYAMSEFLKTSSISHQLYDDGISIEGSSLFSGGTFNSFNDHRIAMSIAISSIIAKNDTIINNHEVASVSYKNFWKHLNDLKI